jgi:NADH-quinone oxidoreductase subunit J
MSEALAVDLGLAVLIVIALAGSVAAVTLKKVFHNLIGFGVAIIGLAGISVVLGSEFVALMQVLIFLGGITVAMVFAVMMSTPREQAEESHPRARILGAVGIAGGLFGSLWWVLSGTTFATAAFDPEAWSTPAIGKLLLTRFELPFEAISLLLLGAIIGSVVVARRTRETLDG